MKRNLKRSHLPISNVTRKQREVIQQLSKDDSIIVLPADKGNVTVKMDKTQYEEKMIQLLKDLSYKAIKKDPTAKLERFKQEVISTVHIGGN